MDEENFNIIFIDKLKKECDFLKTKDKKVAIEIEDLEIQLLELRTPNVWNVYSEGNKEIEMEVGFEQFLLAVSEHTNENIDDLSTFRFYALINFLKQKHRQQNGK